MEEAYKILYRGGSGEITEKKSRFIADLKPVSSEEEALAFIEEIRKKYWDARHHCYVYRIGERSQTVRFSDDGEPAQTAGKPMLDVLAGRDIHDVCAVVTRYFGGTLLGTGGLVRAYSQAVQAGLENCLVVEKRPGVRLSVDTDYNSVGKIQYIAAQMGITALESAYTDRASFTYMVPEEQAEDFEAKLTEATAGRAVLHRSKTVYYGLAEGELILFEK